MVSYPTVFDTNPADIQPVGVTAAAGSNGKMADSGHVHTGMSLVADTGPAGFALQNGTPVILTWTAPNDGRQHSVQVMGGIHCTSAGTGGAINYTATRPDGSAVNITLVAANQTLGSLSGLNRIDVIEANTTVTLNQSSALTAGAEVVFATMWAN